MTDIKVIVQLHTGLHARPAAHFVQEANKFVSDIYIIKENKKVNAKSIMGVMSLAVSRNTEIIIQADGADEDQAVKVLAEMVNKED